MAQLYFKRAKIFLHSTPAGESLRFATGVTGGPIKVPDWVRETETFKRGVADESIIDLTPPGQRGPRKPKEPALGHDPLADAAKKAAQASSEVKEGEEPTIDEPAAEASEEAEAEDEPEPAGESEEKEKPAFGGSTQAKPTQRGLANQPTATGRKGPVKTGATSA
jgi:hypothetical protein